MDSIKYNATNSYQHVVVLGKEGVYTPENIDASTLPAGFYKYNLVTGAQSRFASVTSRETDRFAGSLITKEPLSLRWTKNRKLSEEDWSFEDKDFDFASHFGKKLSIEAQIEQAEAKREQMVEESRLRKKNRGKTKAHEDPDKEL